MSLHEPYRTLSGHFRHEVGHYYWECSSKNSPHLEAFREFFGDETADYAQALKRHYAKGLPADWAVDLCERLCHDASLGGLGRDMGALPAHARHARNGGQRGPILAHHGRHPRSCGLRRHRRRHAGERGGLRLPHGALDQHRHPVQRTQPQHGPAGHLSLRSDGAGAAETVLHRAHHPRRAPGASE